ncbi:myb-like DNA-binding protein [Thraustotheca clavata]|uniref:Myb-like DNA-binding protein n=1 Tax=Thraustotheca clavata TaxID=74557 RepID=A0A1W0A1Z3_9STRA|nr:myb-like DNA-binding protein [Thraustotheca clavata]
MMYFFPQSMMPAVPTTAVKEERPLVTGAWSELEHKRFLVALELYPKGPWKAIANYVGTRTPRQTQTHAQKYREKLFRQMRGLKKGPGSKAKKTNDAMEAVYNEIQTITFDAIDPMTLNPKEEEENEDDCQMQMLMLDNMTFEESLDYLIGCVQEV